MVAGAVALFLQLQLIPLHMAHHRFSINIVEWNHSFSGSSFYDSVLRDPPPYTSSFHELFFKFIFILLLFLDLYCSIIGLQCFSLVSAVQQNESAICIHIPLPS